MVEKAGLYGLIPSGLAIIFLVAAIPVGKWQSSIDTSVQYFVTESHVGLWNTCVKVTKTYATPSGLNTKEVSEILNSSCFDIMIISANDKKKYIQAVRTLLLIALVLTVLSILATLVKYLLLKPWVHEKQQVLIGHVTAVLMLLNGCMVIGAVGMFNTELLTKGFSQDVGFYLAIVAWLLCWIAAGFFLAGGLCIGARMYPQHK